MPPSTTNQVFSIHGLTPGVDYQVQIWTADTVSQIGHLYGFTTDPETLDPGQTVELEGGG